MIVGGVSANAAECSSTVLEIGVRKPALHDLCCQVSRLATYGGCSKYLRAGSVQRLPVSRTTPAGAAHPCRSMTKDGDLKGTGRLRPSRMWIGYDCL